jgi:hypothetical protein
MVTLLVCNPEANAGQVADLNSSFNFARLTPTTTLSVPLCASSPLHLHQVADGLHRFSTSERPLSEFCNSISRAKANLSWIRHCGGPQLAAMSAREILGSTLSASVMPTPLIMGPWAECRFLRNVIALAHQRADVLQLDFEREREEFCVSRVFGEQSNSSFECTQFGQTNHIAKRLNELTMCNVDGEVKNALVLQAEDYTPDDGG